MTDTNNIYIIDGRVSDYETLINALPEGSVWMLLDQNRDGLAQIAGLLSGYAGVSGLHIISHGSEGALQLGATVLSASNLADYRSVLADIGAHLSDTGDILLYGCDVASGADGQAFVDKFADLTGADVAASRDLTGFADAGGNWVLEATNGTVGTAPLKVPGYAATLDLIGGTGGPDRLVSTSRDDIIDGGAGTDTVVLSGNYADYKITPLSNGVVLEGAGGRDVLTNVERLEFADAATDLALRGAAETRVNTYTSSSQANPSVTAMTDGGWVVTWMSDQDGSGFGVYGQRYGAKGVAQGSEFRANTYTSSSQEEPSVTALTDGGWVVAWMSGNQDGSDWGVYGQRYGADGVAQGSEFRANTYTSSSQLNPSVTALADGGWVVTWMSDQDGSGLGVYGQRYGANGVAQGSEFRANTYTGSSQKEPSVAALTDGGWVVTWMSYGQDGSDWGVYGQRYDANGVAQGSEFQANTDMNSSQQSPSVTALADGGWVVTWMSGNQDGSGWGVYGQRYGADGSAQGNEFRANTYTNDQQYAPSVAALTDGGWVVMWMSNEQDGYGYGVYGQRFGVDGVAQGSEFRANTYTNDQQYLPSVTALTDGGWVVTWMSNGQDGSGWGVYSQRYTFDGLAYGDVSLIRAAGPEDDHYTIVNAQDAFSEAVDGGFDIVDSSISWTMSDNIEKLILTGSAPIAGSGNALDNEILGNAAANTLAGGGGNDVLNGGAGDDTIDGGSGYNTLVLSGARSDYIIPTVARRSADGFVISVFSDAALAGIDDGTDTIKNIQKIVFAGEADPEYATTILDDYGNAPDAGNVILQYGKVYAGTLNFKGDLDYFKLATAAGQKLSVEFNHNFYQQYISLFGDYTLGSSSDPNQKGSFTASLSGVQDVSLGNRDWNWSGNRALPYSFIIRRDWTGTDNNDTIVGDGRFEHLMGGAGDDTLTGGQYSDNIEGGSGSDVLRGDEGDDFLDGGSGNNVAVYSGALADYTVSFIGNATWRVTHNNGTDGVDTVSNVQQLRFADQTLVLDDLTNSYDSTTVASYTFGEAISGQANYTGDSDWFQFNFGSYRDKALGIRLDTVNAGGLFHIVNADGYDLIFRDVNGNYVSWIQSGQTLTLTPVGWNSGADPADDPFLGGRVRVEFQSNSASMGSYTISIGRELLGTALADTLLANDGSGKIFEVLRGLAGNDVLTGGAASEQLFGGDGDDSLSGNAGNDFLQGGDGTNIVSGGDGADFIDVSGRGQVLDKIDGGAGADTLQISSGVSLASAQISSIETITSSNGGDFALTAAQLSAWGVTRLENLNIVMATKGTFDAGAFSGNFNVMGSTGNDVIRTGAGNNLINPRAGLVDIAAGAGDDTIFYRPGMSWEGNSTTNSNFLAATEVNRTYSLLGQLDGGQGSDVLEFNFQPYWQHAWGEWATYSDRQPFSIDLSKAQLSGIEELRISGNWNDNSAPAFIKMTAAQLAGFSQLTNVRGVQLVGGGMVDLAAFASKGGVNLTFADEAGYTLIGSSAVDAINDTTGADVIQAGAGNDQITSSAGIDQLSGGAGDDAIILSGKADVADSIDGGAGLDTLRIEGDLVDLSQATISGIENIQVASKSLSMTEAQWAAFGGIITNSPGSVASYGLSMTETGVRTLEEDSSYSAVSGTVGDDTITGNSTANILNGNAGNDRISGGAGDDRLAGGDGDDILIGGTGIDIIDGGAGADTAVFAGNYASYRFTPISTGLLISGPQGSDVLAGVERLQFDDVTVDVTVRGAAETLVNTYTPDTQSQSKTVTLADGSWVVIWQSSNQDGSGWGVFGQMYAADGSAKGNEFRVNARSDGDQTQGGRPAQVTSLSNGGFAVVFDEYGPNGAEGQPNSWNIRGQVFDANGKAVGAEIYVATGANTDLSPSVAELKDGNLVVAWQSDDGSNYGIFGQRLKTDGTFVGSSFAVNTNTTNAQTEGQIIALSDGGWLVAWRSDHNARIQGQRFDANGTAIGQEVQISGNSDARGPNVVALQDGGWIASYHAWYGLNDPENGVFYSRYDSAGAPVGEHVHVNTATVGNQNSPAITVLVDGGWVIAWTSDGQDGSGTGIYAQRYSADGTAHGLEFQVNTYSRSSQAEPAITALADGGWVITWTSSGQDGSNTGIYSQRYTAGGLAYGDVIFEFIGAPTNDSLVGDADNNTFAGGEGSDILIGNGGDDLLITGAGTDSLYGGEGSDRLVVTDKSQVRDLLDGGSGVDTLAVSDGLDLTGATISGIEILQGKGAVTLRPEQVAGLQVIDGLTVQLSGSSAVFAMPAGLALTNGARIMMPAVDTVNAPDQVGLYGSKNDDVLTGSAGNDIVFGGRGADAISGGDGNDIIYGGSGSDVLIGGAGNDRFVVTATEMPVVNQTSYSDRIEGGTGFDTLDVSFGGYGQAFAISDGALASVEALAVHGLNGWPERVIMSGAQWASFSTVRIDGSVYLTLQAGSETLSFSSLVGSSAAFSGITLEGNYGQIDSSAVTVNIDNIAQFDQIKMGSGADRLGVSNDRFFNASAGGGNDTIVFYGSRLSATIDGGSGDDVLDLSGNGYVDISELTLSGVETVRQGNATLLISKEQNDNLAFDGGGKKFVRDGNVIVGTQGNDAFNGTSVETFKGGQGDDLISNVNTFVLNGNSADYDFTRSGNTLTIQHARGSMTDGTDTLSGVMNLKFADGLPVKLDDAPDDAGLFFSAADRSLLTDAAYDKRISATKNFTSDVDIYKSTLVPNSPLAIEASSSNGGDWEYSFFEAATGKQISFRSTVLGYEMGAWRGWMNASHKWMPGFSTNEGFQAYNGGEIVIQARDLVVAPGESNYAFTLRYLDDFAGSVDTTATLDPQVGSVRGYVGSIGDSDWVGTNLIAGTKYEFTLQGVSSGGGTLVDPKLILTDSAGRPILTGVDIITSATGLDDTIVFRPLETGTYFLAVSDVAEVATGAWTLSQKSLDTIAGNVSSTERVEWGTANRFTVSSEVNALTDHDWFRVWLDKGVSYSFREQGSGGGGTLTGPQLSLRSVTGILLSQGSSEGDSSSSRITYSASESGWYFLDAGAFGNASKGTYTLTGSTLVDDFGANLSTQGVVQANGTPVSGLVSFNGDSDWFRVGLSKGQTYLIDLSGDISDSAQLDPLIDPLMIIRDKDGNVITQIDDFNGSLNPRAYFTPSADGLYFIEAKSAFRFDVGAYQLRVGLAPVDDFGGTIEAAADISVGATRDGEIGIPGDHDMFKVSLEAGKVYQIGVSGLAGHTGTLVDPHVRIFNASGRLVDFDANGGVGNDAQLYFAPTSSGTYYIEASAGDDRGMGTYAVQVAQRDLPPDDVADNVSSTTNIAPGQAVTGTLLTHNDQDWFKVTLDGGKNYVLRLQGATSGNGTLNDPLLEIRDASGALIRTVDNTLLANEPATLFTPVSTGNYYLVARAADGNVDTGTYRLVVRAPDDHGNTRADATSVALGQSLDGGIQWSDGEFGVRALDSVGLATDMDEDWFAFSAAAGQVLSFNVSIPDGSTLSRPMVEIVDSLGNPLALADGLETAQGLTSATFRAAEAGSYYARVIDAAGATGLYQVSLTAGDASDEDASGPLEMQFTQTDTLNSAISTARLGLAGDTDTFTVSLQADHSYRIEALAVRDGTTAPIASARLGLNWLATGGSTPNSVEIIREYGTASFFDSTVYAPQSSGNMTIRVSADELLQTGQYRLRVVDLGANEADLRPDSVSTYDPVRDGVLAINENVSGKIDSLGDQDLFAIDLTVGQLYSFSIKSFADGLGTLSQGALLLLDDHGQLVSSGRYDAGSGRTDLSVSVFDSGRYYLSVSPSQFAGNTGTYILDTRLRDASALPADDIAGDSRSGVMASPGKTASGSIEYAGDSDWVRVSLEAGKVYVLDVLADGSGQGGTLKDATMRLLDAAGNEIAVDDNGGAGLDARLQFAPRDTGTYYLDVGSGGGQKGSYTVRIRELYTGLADPLVGAQWYRPLIGIDQMEGEFTGAAVTIGMIDDGIDTTHPDLQNQIDYRNSYDTVGNTANGANKIPYPTNPFGDFHGTAVAGLMVAQANNEAGIVGVAPDADVASIRVKWSWEQITEALGLQFKFDISNNSWGAIAPFSDNFNSTSLTFAYEGLRRGVEDGREGKGTVFVFSAGNSASSGMNTNYFNFQNAREVITVGAVNEDGSAAAFSTPGASVLVGAYGVNLLTTDRHEPGLGLVGSSNYTSFTGTSAAAPLVSAVVALMLEANPNLGYRDVQEILAYSATHSTSQNWKVNGASNSNLGGLQFNDESGFGIVNVASAVALAQTWTEADSAINEAVVSARSFGMNATIPDAGVLTRTFTIGNSLSVEHVELGIDLTHTRMADLIIELTSPSGTVSRLMNRPTANAEQPYGLSGEDSGVPTHLLWDFSSVQFWGEDAAGQWTITVRDVRAEETGWISSLSLRVFGERESGNDTYVFTDEGFVGSPVRKLADESGIDTINAAPVHFDMLVDLNGGIIAANGLNYGIENWTVIENAISGSGSDRLIGHAEANTLNGRSGNDVLQGGGGNDTLIGGNGADIARYAGNIVEFGLSWNPDTKVLTVIDRQTSNGDEGTDTLTGIERLVFADGEISLSDQVGNQVPVATRSVFANPVLVGKGVGLNYDLPENAFSDDAGNSDLQISVASASGGELPEWLSYDPASGKVTGVPPADLQGQIKLLVTATDSFGKSATETLTLQFGDNQAPIVDALKFVTLNEDAALSPLGISTPVDPEGKVVDVTILEVPSIGVVLDKAGNVVAVGSKIAAADMQELHYQAAADANGNAGLLRYEAKDEDGVTSQSSVRLFIDPVNDAPRFATASSKLLIQYPSQGDVALDFERPIDPETNLSTVRVIDLPALGQIILDGRAVTLNQILTFDQLGRLSFVLSENVNGPIGAVTIQAVDDQGAATNWSLALEVQGQAGSNQGTSGDDQLYGSTGTDILYGYAGNDALVGNAGNDRLLGGLGDDRLFGGSGDDQLDGSSGNDYLDGGSGKDTMSGGPGNDTYVVDGPGDTVLEVISGGAGGKDTVATSISLTAMANIESLVAVAGFAINLTGNTSDNGLSGNELDNRLLGGAGRDVLIGYAGNDTLDGGSDIDRMLGGMGDDIYFVDSRFDEVIENANEGSDAVYAASSYTLSANVEKLVLHEGGDWTAGGNSLDNILIGNSGNNVLSGGIGKDTLSGGLGNDTYILSDSLDTIIDTGGIDVVRSSLDIVLQADIENGELVGIADTTLTGNASANSLVGNSGNNILDGYAGVDTLTGGAGGDQFVISYNGLGLASDLITDFKAGDDLVVIDLASFGIDLQSLGANSSGLVSEGAFVRGGGATALDANDRFVLDTAQGKLFYDLDGSGSSAPIELVHFSPGLDANFMANSIYVAI